MSLRKGEAVGRGSAKSLTMIISQPSPATWRQTRIVAKTILTLTLKILAHGRTKCHLDVLEDMYIHVLDPVLCRQKRFVTYLTLFKHAHSSTVDKTYITNPEARTFMQFSLHTLLSHFSARPCSLSSINLCFFSIFFVSFPCKPLTRWAKTSSGYNDTVCCVCFLWYISSVVSASFV